MLDKLARLSLISKISNIESINKLFNDNLPILLQVLDKTKTGYLLRLGDRIIDAKSAENISIGSKYWGILRENNNGLLISNLIKQPKILDEVQKSPILFDIATAELVIDGESRDLLQLGNDKLRDILVSLLERVDSKEEFILLSNMLFSLKYGITTFVIRDREKQFLTQIKSKCGKIEFCAAFSSLGIIYGELYHNDLILKVQFELTKKILLKYADELPFNIMDIILDNRIQLFFDMDNILDMEA